MKRIKIILEWAWDVIRAVAYPWLF